MKEKTALLFGASGLIGHQLLRVLLNATEYNHVKVMVRNSLGIQHPKLEEVVIDFDQLSKYKKHFGVDDVFCCLGTTMKKAGSKEAFKKVDLEYPLLIGEMAKEKNARNFLIVSSIGADPKSTIFYNRIKGQLEQGLKKMKFRSLHIFQPSLLLGNRKEFRFGERVGALIGKGLSFMFIGRIKKYKPIKAEKVAQGMYRMAQRRNKGVHTYSSNEIAKME